MGKSCKPPPIPLPSAGMFLRGYGTSKPYYIHQNDIAKEHSQTFSSGALGEFEQDSIRDSFSGIPNVMTMDARSRILQSWGYPIPPSPVVWWQLPYGYADGMKYTLPSGAVVTNSSLIAKLSYEGKRVWVSTRPPKKYRLHGHGGENASYSLKEYDDTENGEYHDIDKFDWGLDLGYMMKAADEIKPVNVAVRYFIKAR